MLHCKNTNLCSYIVIQVVTAQETVTGMQHYSDQHQITANYNDSASNCEQQSSVHQPTPQYALLDYKPEDQGASISRRAVSRRAVVSRQDER